MSRPTVLVVDDEKLVRWALRQRLEEAGYRVQEAETGQAALAMAASDVDLVLLDFKLPDMDGLQVLRELKAAEPELPVVLLTGHSSVESAVEAMKRGAYHYALKPFNVEEVLLLVEKALETSRLRREVKTLRARQSAPHGLGAVIGESAAMKRVLQLLVKVAESPSSTVLITGESGTGKDLAAKVIHYNSARAEGPFQNITCSALPEALLESELFGHERGAFTDARQQRKGLLELADGGTAFLDEIGEMSAALQAKLLRFLEEKAFKRVGGANDVAVDVRVIAATHRDLAEEVRSGRFREDLYYRLQVLLVVMPPLRDRAGDLPLLVRHYVEVFNREFRKKVHGVAPAALARLESHPWPGNVRELRNAVERAMLLTDSDVLQPDDFEFIGGTARSGDAFRLPPAGVKLEDVERDLVVQALHRCGGNQTRAAQLLGVNRDQIRYRIEKFGLGKPELGEGRAAG